jgi:hypothetical protein
MYKFLPSSSLSGVCSLILTPVANLPSVLLIRRQFATSVVDTGGKLRISPRIFEKIRNDAMLLSGAWGKVIHEKKPEAKNLVTLSI